MIPAITGLSTALDLETGYAMVMTDGLQAVNVRVSWSTIDSILVTAGGGVQLRWYVTTESPITYVGETTVAGVMTDATVKGLVEGTSYTIEVRAVGANGQVGDWASTNITINPTLALSGPPQISAGPNLWDANWNLERRIPPKLWNIVDATSTMTGASATWVETGGYYGPHALQFTSTAGTVGGGANDDYDLEYETQDLYVTPGDVYVLAYSLMFSSGGSGGGRIKMRVLYYDSDGSFITGGNELLDDYTDATGGSWERRVAGFQVPDLTTPAVKAQAEFNVLRRTASGAETVTLDGFSFARARRWVPQDYVDGTINVTEVAPDWGVIIGVGAPGGASLWQPPDQHLKVEVTMMFEAWIEALWDEPSPPPADRIRARWSVFRYDIDADTHTTIISAKVIGSFGPGDGFSNGDEHPDPDVSGSRLITINFEDVPPADTRVIYRARGQLTAGAESPTEATNYRMRCASRAGWMGIAEREGELP